MILAGDIGGTKTNLALFEYRDNILHVVAQQQFSSREFSNLNEVITAFMQKASMPSIDAACFGIAGPVEGAIAGTSGFGAGVQYRFVCRPVVAAAPSARVESHPWQSRQSVTR